MLPNGWRIFAYLRATGWKNCTVIVKDNTVSVSMINGEFVSRGLMETLTMSKLLIITRRQQ